jgi:branched-chain amino acid transport system substrate-binding protein
MVRTHRALFSIALAVVVPQLSHAEKKYDPGATDTEIKVGHTNPYSGPASSHGTIRRSEAAYFRMINEQAGINGRKINFIGLDDSYSPPRTVEQTRKLVEQADAVYEVQEEGMAEIR